MYARLTLKFTAMIKVHTLVRVILIIPRLVISSWYTQRANWGPVDVAASAFDLAKTFIEAVALVVIPANVHATVSVKMNQHSA